MNIECTFVLHTLKEKNPILDKEKFCKTEILSVQDFRPNSG